MLAALLLSLLTALAPPPMPADSTLLLFDFDRDAEPWRVQNDGVMGGKSKGYVEIEDGALVFTGTVVTEGGGFTSVLTSVQHDLSAYDGVELRVRGGGRTFELQVGDGSRGPRGREVSRRAPFPTSEEWQTVRVAFDDLQASIHGEPYDAEPLDRSAIQRLGLYIIDGQDGPFRLEVDWMRAYAAESG
jgi:hypothetical protein